MLQSNHFDFKRAQLTNSSRLQWQQHPHLCTVRTLWPTHDLNRAAMLLRNLHRHR